MKIKISPSKNHTNIKVPTSKSLAHRYLIASALSCGTSIIKDIALSDDVLASLEAIEKLGSRIEITDNQIKITTNGLAIEENAVIDVKDSASTLRFLIPIIATSTKEVTLTGSEQLFSRPLNIYQDIWTKQNLLFKQDQNNLTISGKLNPGTFKIAGNISSQFVSGLLFALPMLKENSTIIFTTPVESNSYIDMTLAVLKDHGINIIRNSDGTITIEGNQTYQPFISTIEKDFSQAANFLTLGAINSPIEVKDLNLNSLQGDKAILSILEKQGALVNKGKVSKGKLQGTTIDIQDTPDLGPILCILAAASEDLTTLVNTKRLAYKESNRLAVMKEELAKLNIKISLEENSATIYPWVDKPKELVTLYSHMDHRIAMALAIIATIAKAPVIIEGAECVNKSYPNFFDDLKNIGIKVEEL